MLDRFVEWIEAGCPMPWSRDEAGPSKVEAVEDPDREDGEGEG